MPRIRGGIRCGRASIGRCWSNRIHRWSVAAGLRC